MTTPAGASPADIVNDLARGLAPEAARADGADSATPFDENDAPSATELVTAAPALVHSAPRVVLVGMPGAGKSTIGRRIASALNLPIVDSDLLMEQGEGKACGELYSELGEDAFRELEVGYVAARSPPAGWSASAAARLSPKRCARSCSATPWCGSTSPPRKEFAARRRMRRVRCSTARTANSATGTFWSSESPSTGRSPASACARTSAHRSVWWRKSSGSLTWISPAGERRGAWL